MSVGGGAGRLPEKIGKYRVVEPIGRGGMGMIFKAHDPILDRLVAIKVISPEVEVTDELRARFFREAKACAKLNHPNIVTVHDMGEHDGRLFIVMELLEGQELRRLITPGTPLALEDKLSVMVQACAGLHYAHEKGIIHRDIKPGNIFLLPDGLVKILDFGIAHMATTDQLTRTGQIMGTLRYGSPEQVRGRVDYRSDMFSLGSVFYELLALRPPFQADGPIQLLEQLRTDDPPRLNELDASIPPALTSIVQRAMRKNPAERFRDLDEMRGKIEEVQRGINEEWQRVSVRVRGQRQRILQLQAEVAERLGKASRDAAIPGIDDPRGLVAIQALEREFGDRIAALESEIAEAEAGASFVKRKPGHSAIARNEAPALSQEAEEVAGDDRERERRRARVAREQAGEGRRSAAAFDAARKAPASWHEAVGKASAGEAAWLRKEYAKTTEAFEAALYFYHQAESQIREAERRQREQSIRKQQAASAARSEAEAVEAAVDAATEWLAAEESVAAAEVALRSDEWEEASAGFDRAVELYRKAEARAREGRP